MPSIGSKSWPAWGWDAAAVAFLVLSPAFFLREEPGGLPPYGGDILVHVYPLLSLLAHGLHAGRPALWNYYAAGGYPLEPYSALAFYPPVLLALLFLPVTGALAALYALYLAVLGVGTYLLAADLGQSRPARLLAAVTLAQGGFVAAHAYAGHIFELGAICPLPLAFLLLRRATLRHSPTAAVWCGAVMGLMVLAAGVQFLPFALAPLPLLALWHTGLRLITPHPPSPSPASPAPPARGTRGALWPLAALGAASATALALSAVFALPFAEILPRTLRAGAVPLATATAQSLPWPGLTMLVAPDALGNAAAGAYWPAGRSNPYFHEIYAYAGLLPLLLAPVALLRRAAWPYGLLALGALLAMLGGNTPLYALLYHLPGAGLFRVPARAGLTLDFALALLAGFGLDALPRGGWRRTLRALMPGVFIGLVALWALSTIAASAGHGDGIPASARALALHASARLVAGLLLGLAACVALAVASPPSHQSHPMRRRRAWTLVLPALALLDLYTANGPLLRPTDPAAYYSAAAGILSPRDPVYRVLAADINTPAVPAGLCMVTRACYDVQDAAPLALEEYWQLSHPSIVRREGRGVSTGRDTAVDVDPTFLRLFGVRTLYSAAPLRNAGLVLADRLTSVRWSAPGGADWNVHRRRAPSLVYRNRAALPRLFVAPGSISAGDDMDALALVRRPDIDLRRVVVLSPAGDGATGPTGATDPTGPTGPLGAIQGAWAEWLAPDPDNSLMASADGGTRGGYLVVDDGWSPGWTATVDGRAAPVLRADYLLRAVRLPPGRHTVRLVYAPLAYLLGTAITLATALALLGLAAYRVVRRVRRGPMARSVRKMSAILRFVRCRSWTAANGVPVMALGIGEAPASGVSGTGVAQRRRWESIAALRTI